MEVGYGQVNRHKNIDSMEIYEMFQFVDGVNKKLGYRLFRDIYSYSLKHDFEKDRKSSRNIQKERENNKVYEGEKFVRDTEFKEGGEFITAPPKY